jgi:hypothetical protein
LSRLFAGKLPRVLLVDRLLTQQGHPSDGPGSSKNCNPVRD